MFNGIKISILIEYFHTFAFLIAEPLMFSRHFEGWLNGLGKINVLNKNSPFLIIKFGYRKSSSVSFLRCLKQDICLSNGDSPLLSLFITLSERGRLCEEAKMMPCSTRLRERESWLPCVFASGIQDEKFDFLNYHFHISIFNRFLLK